MHCYWPSASLSVSVCAQVCVDVIGWAALVPQVLEWVLFQPLLPAEFIFDCVFRGVQQWRSSITRLHSNCRRHEFRQRSTVREERVADVPQHLTSGNITSQRTTASEPKLGRSANRKSVMFVVEMITEPVPVSIHRSDLPQNVHDPRFQGCVPLATCDATVPPIAALSMLGKYSHVFKVSSAK